MARIAWLVIAVVATASCSIGAPPGFSKGTRWTFPLVDPLDDGLLVTPVFVKGQGPFLFAIDPDAHVTIIDERVAIAAHLVIDNGYATRLWSEDGERRVRFNAELRNLEVGNLDVEVRRALVVPHGTLRASGREVMGVLGRNVIADSLVFAFDRDRGLAWLEDAQAFVPPAGATRVAYSPTQTYTPMVTPGVSPDAEQALSDEPGEPQGTGLIGSRPDSTAFDGRAGVTDNRAELAFTHVKLDGRDRVLAIQLGSAITRLRDTLADGLARTAIEFDATGARRTLAVEGSLRAEIGSAANDHVAVAHYIDRTEIPSNARFFDGTLGLDFFAPFEVYADWSRHAIYLAPRDPAPQTALRLHRWSALAHCAHPGCVTATVTSPAAPAPPDTTTGFAPTEVHAKQISVLHVRRDPGTNVALEIRLRPVGRSDMPDLLVELPAGTRDALAPLRDPVQYEVVDASPFAAPCPGDGGCVLTTR